MRIGSISWNVVRFFRALALGVVGRCPVCGHGKLFRTFFKINDSCPHCHASFIGSGNQSTGAMGINVVVTIALGFGGVSRCYETPSAQFRDATTNVRGLPIFAIHRCPAGWRGPCR